MSNGGLGFFHGSRETATCTSEATIYQIPTFQRQEQERIPSTKMEAIKQYVRQQICLPPATIIQRWSEYMDAEAKLLSQHRAEDAKLLAEHVSAQSSLLDQHLNARAVLLSSFTGQVNQQEPRIRLVNDEREVLRGYLEYVSGVLDSGHKSIVAGNNLPIEVAVLIVLAGYIAIPCRVNSHG